MTRYLTMSYLCKCKWWVFSVGYLAAWDNLIFFSPSFFCRPDSQTLSLSLSLSLSLCLSLSLSLSLSVSLSLCLSLSLAHMRYLFNSPAYQLTTAPFRFKKSIAWFTCRGKRTNKQSYSSLVWDGCAVPFGSRDWVSWTAEPL